MEEVGCRCRVAGETGLSSSNKRRRYAHVSQMQGDGAVMQLVPGALVDGVRRATTAWNVSQTSEEP